MISDIEKLKVHASPEALAELETRKYDDTNELTAYALAHGVALPEGYEPGWSIVVTFDDDGNELGLFWDGYGPSDENEDGFPVQS